MEQTYCLGRPLQEDVKLTRGITVIEYRNSCRGGEKLAWGAQYNNSAFWGSHSYSVVSIHVLSTRPKQCLSTEESIVNKGARKIPWTEKGTLNFGAVWDQEFITIDGTVSRFQLSV